MTTKNSRYQRPPGVLFLLQDFDQSTPKNRFGMGRKASATDAISVFLSRYLVLEFINFND